MTQNNIRKYGNILGIDIDSTTAPRVLAMVRAHIATGRKFYIVTPNPEIVLKAQKDNKLKEVINKASISLPDGIAIIHADKFLKMTAPKSKIIRWLICLIQGLFVGLTTFSNKKWLFSDLKLIKGRDVFMDLMHLANKKGWRVFFLGGKENEAELSAKNLEKSLKRVKLQFFAGPLLNFKGEPQTPEEEKIETEAVQKINSFKPHLLFVAFEAPKQEKWVFRWFPKLNIGGAMVVGGTFRYIAGKAPLPPKWTEESSLEWLWRLWTEPWRIRRIFNAIIIFPLKVFLYKLRSN